MSRVPQRRGERGSLKWIQSCVNAHQQILDDAILAHLPNTKSIAWRSPLASDEFAEYRDGAFLSALRLDRLTDDLAQFWPARGPQWDALGVCDTGDVLLIEAKAYIAEFRSPPSAAKAEASIALIRASLGQTIDAFGATARSDWSSTFYQYANRLAHLYFLRRAKVPAWLVLVNFIGDHDMKGPETAGEWETAYAIANHALGLDEQSPLMRHVLHVYLDVSRLI